MVCPLWIYKVNTGLEGQLDHPMFRATNKNTRLSSGTCLKLTIKIEERLQVTSFSTTFIIFGVRQV